MRMLFEIDKKDYDINGVSFSRPSARGIIIQDGRIAMIHSIKYDYYKFPGGGIEADETREDALVREILEETGLHVKRDSIREYGMVHRIQKGDWEDIFIQDNYYYLCSVGTEVQRQQLDDYEEEEKFTLEYVTAQEAIAVNKRNELDGVDRVMLEREIRILKMLEEEGFLGDGNKNTSDDTV